MCLFIQCIFDLEIELLLVLISSASFRISTGSQSAPKVASRIQVCLHYKDLDGGTRALPVCAFKCWLLLTAVQCFECSYLGLF